MSASRKDYWRAVALVFSGTAAAQIIPLVGSLVIARLYIPSEFGIYVAWLGITSLAAVFVTGRFEMALALEPDGDPRSEAASATAITTGLILGALTVVSLCLWPLIESRWQVPAGLAALFIPATAALAAAQIWQAWAAAEGLFRPLSVMRILQAGGITGLQIAVGLTFPSAYALALAHLVGVGCGVAYMAKRLPLRRQEGREWLFRFWRRYMRFPVYALPADTVNTAAAQLPLTILASRFGPDVAGYVALAFRTLGAPISLLGSAVLDVFKRRAAVAWRETGSCRGPFVETFLVLTAGSFAATAVFWFTGEPLFVVAFGERWREAGTLAVILLPLFSLRFVASPLSYTFYIAEKQPIDLIWQVCLLAMTLAALFLPETFRSAIIAYTYGYSTLYVVYLLLSYRFSAGPGQ